MRKIIEFRNASIYTGKIVTFEGGIIPNLQICQRVQPGHTECILLDKADLISAEEVPVQKRCIVGCINQLCRCVIPVKLINQELQQQRMQLVVQFIDKNQLIVPNCGIQKQIQGQCFQRSIRLILKPELILLLILCES